MLKFATERNATIDATIERIEKWLGEASYETRGSKPARASLTKCARLLIEALDVIKKLTGK
jgi:hypothetical protein